MITIIFGDTKIGKTAFMTMLATKHMSPLQAREDLASSRAIVDQLNNGGYHLTLPDKHLVFSDYEIRYKAYDCSPRVSFWVDGFRLGLPNTQHETLFLPPYSQIFLSEAQRYYNSRESSTLSDFVSRFYEMHGHWRLNITMDCQRADLIDLNIRDITPRIIQIEAMEIFRDKIGNIAKTVWTVREFKSNRELQLYLSNENTSYGKLTDITYNSNILDFYDSTACFPVYLKDCENKDFDLLPHKHIGYNIDDVKFYNEHMGAEVPPTYRKSRSKK